jgi:formylglycine-generating enzyme required for sulfatase activity
MKSGFAASWLIGVLAASAAGKPAAPVEWVSIDGGKFMMGDDQVWNYANPKPMHEVSIKDFALSKTLVTVEQYAECVSKGGCAEPGVVDTCNWGVEGRRRHPINCVDWSQANQYAKFMAGRPGFEGARLPSESEWEYAATSGGKKQAYPWGDEPESCDRVVMKDKGDRGYGCGTGSTMPVCSKPRGNAKVSGGELCDLAGNVWEWMQDAWHDSYVGAPRDGAAWGQSDLLRVIRGGSWVNDGGHSRTVYRSRRDPGSRPPDVGFRLARSPRR